MKVRQIYKKYKVPSNLQAHMLRVGSIAKIITDNWKGEEAIDTEAIVQACLFHDMGNIIKFTFSGPILLDDPENTEYWQKVQKEFIEKYGEDEHHANVLICKEIGLKKHAIDMVESITWKGLDKLINDKKFDFCITDYCDMRISPFGISNIEDRIKNVVERNPRNKPFQQEYLEKGKLLENELQKRVGVNLNTLNDVDIEKNFEFLKNLEI